MDGHWTDIHHNDAVLLIMSESEFLKIFYVLMGELLTYNKDCTVNQIKSWIKKVIFQIHGDFYYENVTC